MQTTNAGTATASYTLQEMITIQVLTTARTLVLVKHHQQPVVTVTGAPFTYRLAQTPATVSVTGAGGLNHTDC
jgi:hypothetical protein